MPITKCDIETISPKTSLHSLKCTSVGFLCTSRHFLLRLTIIKLINFTIGHNMSTQVKISWVCSALPKNQNLIYTFRWYKNGVYVAVNFTSTQFLIKERKKFNSQWFLYILLIMFSSGWLSYLTVNSVFQWVIVLIINKKLNSFW